MKKEDKTRQKIVLSSVQKCLGLEIHHLSPLIRVGFYTQKFSLTKNASKLPKRSIELRTAKIKPWLFPPPLALFLSQLRSLAAVSPAPSSRRCPVLPVARPGPGTAWLGGQRQGPRRPLLAASRRCLQAAGETLVRLLINTRSVSA